MTSRDPVVVTGLGVVEPGAFGVEEAAARFADPRPEPEQIDRPEGLRPRCKSRLGLLVDRSRIGEWLPPMAARRMSVPSRFAVVAAKMAIQQAKLESSDLGEATAVVVATSFSSSETTEQILRQILLDSPEAISPAAFTESVANAAAAHIAITLGARGANITVTQREAGLPIALARAQAELLHGRTERVLVGATDELTPLLHAILGRAGALALPDENGVEVARPFDARRSGWMAAEGAVVAVLENESSARAREVPILARLVGSGSGFDPSAPRNGWSPNAETLLIGLREFLRRQGVEISAINRVVSGARGSPRGDALEAQILSGLWGEEELPSILAPAAVLGSYGGSLLSGAILAAAGRPFGPTPGFEELDKSIGVRPHDGRPLTPPELVLLVSCAVGGSAGWSLFGAPSR